MEQESGRLKLTEIYVKVDGEIVWKSEIPEKPEKPIEEPPFHEDEIPVRAICPYCDYTGFGVVSKNPFTIECKLCGSTLGWDKSLEELLEERVGE